MKHLKLKVACGTISALQPVGRLYLCPNEFPSFITRGATHHIETSASEGGNYTWNFASYRNSHAAKLGHGTDSLTSPPKEGMRRIFQMPEKCNDFGRV